MSDFLELGAFRHLIKMMSSKKTKVQQTKRSSPAFEGHFLHPTHILQLCPGRLFLHFIVRQSIQLELHPVRHFVSTWFSYQWFTSSQYEASHPNSEALAMNHGVPVMYTLPMCTQVYLGTKRSSVKVPWWPWWIRQYDSHKLYRVITHNFMKYAQIKLKISHLYVCIHLMSAWYNMSAWLKWDKSAKVRQVCKSDGWKMKWDFSNCHLRHAMAMISMDG